MNQKMTCGLLLLTAIALFVAPHAARLYQMIPAIPFMPFLFLGLWLTVVIKNLSSPG